MSSHLLSPLGMAILLPQLLVVSAWALSSITASATYAPPPPTAPLAHPTPLSPPPSTDELPPTAAPTDNPDAPTQEIEDDAPSWIHTITTQFQRLSLCVPRLGPLHCLKMEALLLLGGHADTAEGPGDALAMLAALPSDATARDARLNELLTRAARTAAHEMLYGTPPGVELQQRGKRKRWGTQIMLALFVLAGTVVATGIGKTAMVAGKALAVSILALMLAVVTGFRRTAAGAGGNANYEILTTGLRRRNGFGPVLQRERRCDQDVGGHGQLEPDAEHLPQDNAQSLAYWSHHTRRERRARASYRAAGKG